MPNADNKTPQMSRAWEQYLVKAVLDQTASDWPARSEADIRAYEDSSNHEHECQLFALPTPVAMSSDVNQIITVVVGGKKLRLYPPFPLNEKKHASGSFTHISIPEGPQMVEETTPITS